MRYIIATLLLPLTVSASCAPPLSSARQAELTAPAPPTISPATAGANLSYQTKTYRDEVNGFEFNFPADWTIEPNTQSGSRGAQVQLFSPGTTAEQLAPNGSRLSVTVFQWDPKGDLGAFVSQRRGAWEAGGLKVRDGSTRTLLDGRPASDFFIEAPDGVLSYFLLTTSGDQYLQLAGEGDLQLLESVARTLRPLNYQP